MFCNENKLTRNLSVDCFEIKSVAEEVTRKLAQVDNDIRDKIRKSIAIVLNIE